MPGKKKMKVLAGKSILMDVLMIFFLVVFSLLHKVNSYSFSLFRGDVFLYIFLWTLILLAIWVALRWFSHGDRDLIGLLILLGAFMLNMGEIQDMLLYNFHSKFLASTWTLFGCLVLIAVAGLYFWNGRTFVYSRAHQFLLILLLIFSLIETIKLFLPSGKDHYSRYQMGTPRMPLLPYSGSKKPSVFFIIFDSYTNDSCLRQHWHFSNDSIFSFLRQNHFAVTTSSRSSYDFTPLSINSTLNLDYLK